MRRQLSGLPHLLPGFSATLTWHQTAYALHQSDPFRTAVALPGLPFGISSGSNIAALGSCFAESIGHFLKQKKISTLSNPFGTVYNPVSLERQIVQITLGRLDELLPDCLVAHDGMWHSLEHHSTMSRSSKQQLEEDLRAITSRAHTFYQQAKVIIITLGSAYAYRHKSTGHIVANCHRIPAEMFEKVLLPLDEVITACRSIAARLQDLNRSVQLVWTVSPVKYLRDGLHGNNLSKSILHLAVHDVTSHFDYCHYYPAFEILNDELRDYRFFASDMAHPSEEAVRYIGSGFFQIVADSECRARAQAIERLTQLLRHRPRFRNSVGFQTYIQKIEGLIEELEAQYPDLPLDEEKAGLALLKGTS